MKEQLFGSLVVRLVFVKHVEVKAFYSRQSRLIAFHGTLAECKDAYKAWLGWNPALVDQVQATFEVREAVHQNDL